MKIIPSIILTISFIVFTSFTGIDKSNSEFSSSYSFTRLGESQPLIELSLNDDFTFEFTDNSDPEKDVLASGFYKIEGRKIHLYDYQSNFPIANTWKKDKEFDCIESRKGLEFTRICH